MAGARGLTVYSAITGLAAVHFMLKMAGTSMENTTRSYVFMWILSMLMLLWLRVYGFGGIKILCANLRFQSSAPVRYEPLKLFERYLENFLAHLAG